MKKIHEVMKSRVEKLMDGERKEILVRAIDDLGDNMTPEQAISVNCLIGTGVIGKTSADGFERHTKVTPIEFPRDHYTHEQFALEWYAGGGDVKCTKFDSGNNRIGEPVNFRFIYCFFFRRIEKGNQEMILETHFSLVSKNKKQLQSKQSAVWNSNNSLELPDPDNKKFAIKSPNLQLTTLQKDELFFDKLQVHGADEEKQVAIDFELKRVNPFVLQGNNGYQGDLKNGIAYGYYSTPLFETTGTLKYDGEDYSILDGISGIDHEWGTIGTPLSRKTQIICEIIYAMGMRFRFLDAGFGLFGYESWFGFQFYDGSFITSVAADIRKLPANTFITPGSPFSHYLNPRGEQTEIPELKLRIVEFVELDGSKYPSKIEFMNTPVGKFFATVIAEDQRMEWAGGGYAYEGGVVVTDSSGKEIGSGNLENCGWDKKFTESVLKKLNIDKSHVELFESRSKKRGRVLAAGFLAGIALVLSAGIWGISRLFF